MALRTPLTGIVSLRTSPHSGVSMFRKTLACFACRMTSSRVTSPARPVATISVSSTPRSFASFRIGGFARRWSRCSACARARAEGADRLGGALLARVDGGFGRRGGVHTGGAARLGRERCGPAGTRLATGATRSPSRSRRGRHRRTRPCPGRSVDRDRLDRRRRCGGRGGGRTAAAGAGAQPAPRRSGRGLRDGAGWRAAGWTRPPARRVRSGDGRRASRLLDGVRRRREGRSGRDRVDADDRLADLDRVALGHEQARDGAGERRRQLDERLRGLDLDEHLVDGDLVPDRDAPLHDLGLGETFTHVGQGEFGGGHYGSFADLVELGRTGQ